MRKQLGAGLVALLLAGVVSGAALADPPNRNWQNWQQARVEARHDNWQWNRNNNNNNRFDFRRMAEQRRIAEQRRMAQWERWHNQRAYNQPSFWQRMHVANNNYNNYPNRYGYRYGTNNNNNLPWYRR